MQKLLNTSLEWAKSLMYKGFAQSEVFVEHLTQLLTIHLILLLIVD